MGETKTDEQAESGDVLPEDLQPRLVDPEDYVFPNNNRRRIPAVLYLSFAAALLVLTILVRDSPLVNGGFVFAGAVIAAFGLYSWVSSWDLAVDERDSLVIAIKQVGFTVGHASAQMGWRGLLSRPTWRILVYSSEDPPLKRGLVLVDGVDGHVVEHFVEDNPEDWSEVDESGSTS